MAKSVKKNSRKMGLQYVREVKHILEGRGVLVDGPFFKSVFIPGSGGKGPRQMVGHVDMFGVGDLVALAKTNPCVPPPMLNCGLWLIQVTTVDNEASHFETLDKVPAELPVLLFARCKVKNEVVYRVKNRIRERLGGYNLKGEWLNVVQCWER
jgi:hypothetical protein